MKKIFLISILVCIITACNVRNSLPTTIPSLTPKPKLSTVPSVTVTSTATITSTPTQQLTETLPPSATSTQSATANSAGIAPLEALESYRLEGKSVSKNGGSPTELRTSYTKEWVKASQAQHNVLIASDTTSKYPPSTTEMIRIGGTTWIKNDKGWGRIDSQQPPAQQTNTNWQHLTFVGDEIVNEIPCKHYTIDEDVFSMSGFGGQQDVTAHHKGDIWVANRSDLPPVILRAKIQIKISGFFFAVGTPTTTPDPFLETAATQPPQDTASDDQYIYDEYEVTDINTTIIIEPPKLTPEP